MSALTPPLSRARQWVKALGALFPALVVALPPFFLVREAAYRATLTTLGRDQGIFQYIGWAITRGECDYRDVRDVNGPLTHLIHVVFLWLGGRDEHRFHVLDLIVTGASFAITGACLPGLWRDRSTFLRGWINKLGWAFAAWVVLMGQYLLYLYWDLAQRESFFDWFLLPAMGLQLVAQRRLAAHAKWGSLLLVVSGALSALPIFGKPTFAIFTIVQVVAVAIDSDVPQRLRSRLGLFLLGCALGASTQLAFLLVYGDLGAFVKIYLVDVPTMYRFMMPRTATEILSLQWGGSNASLSMVTSIVMLGLIWDKQMPRRAFALAVLPLAGVISVLAQSKGFPYHFHPVTAGLHLQWLVLVVWATERFANTTSLGRLVPIACAAALAARVGSMMPLSPHIDNLWILKKGQTPELRLSQDYLVYFRGPDFFPWEMREGAAYLKEHTAPSDRVQLYGMDPYLLFLAERRSATPYIYAYDLNADAALGGSWLPSGLHPTKDEAARITALRDEHEQDMLERLKKSPPAAFVFIDKAPLTTYEDSATDFRVHCKTASAWVDAHYRETAAFGEVHVWMRTDLADAR